MGGTAVYNSTNLCYLSSLKTRCSIPCPSLLLTPNLGLGLGFGGSLKSHSLKLSHHNYRRKISDNVSGIPLLSCMADDDDTTSVASNASTSEVSFDLKLPRRSLLVQFTCNACGERTKRLINRLAYTKGTVFVQCAGCSQYHKLVDNHHLVVEYDLRDDVDLDLNADQA